MIKPIHSIEKCVKCGKEVKVRHIYDFNNMRQIHLYDECYCKDLTSSIYLDDCNHCRLDKLQNMLN